MHLKTWQLSLSRWTAATISASDVTLKKGSQHTGQVSPMDSLRPHKSNVAHKGETQKKETKLRRGDAGSGNAWGKGGRYWWPPKTEARGLSLSTASSFALQQMGGKENTHKVDSVVPSSPSLTSSFSLLPSYCVGGSANRKVRVSETEMEGPENTALGQYFKLSTHCNVVCSFSWVALMLHGHKKPQCLLIT